MSTVSQALLDRAESYLTLVVDGATVNGFSDYAGIHRVTAGDAFRELVQRGIARRVRVQTGTGGQPPFAYYLMSMAGDQPEQEVTSTDLVYRTGTVSGRVAAYVSRLETGERFTVGAIRKQLNRVGDGNVTRNAVLMGVKKLVDSGYAERTDNVRKSSDGSREPYYRVLRQVPRPANSTVRKTKRKSTASAPAVNVTALKSEVEQLREELQALRQGLASLVS